MHLVADILTLLSQAETLTTPAQELQHLVAFVGVRDWLPQACRNHLCIVHTIFHPCAWYHMRSRAIAGWCVTEGLLAWPVRFTS